jgi:hypothetical protein
MPTPACIVIGGNMAHPSHRLGTECDYESARSELDLLPTAGAAPDPRADDLLAWIEECQSSSRFVPDWSDESYRNAA